MKAFTLIIVFFWLIFFSSCEYQDVKVGDIEGIKVVELTKKDVSLEIMIPIQNDNKFRFKIKKVDLDINLNGNELGKVREVNNIKIKPKSNETYNLLVKVEFSKLFKNSLNLLGSIISQKNAKLKLKGYIKVKAFCVGKTIEIDVDKPVKMLNLDKFKL